MLTGTQSCLPCRLRIFILECLRDKLQLSMLFLEPSSWILLTFEECRSVFGVLFDVEKTLFHGWTLSKLRSLSKHGTLSKHWTLPWVIELDSRSSWQLRRVSNGLTLVYKWLNIRSPTRRFFILPKTCCLFHGLVPLIDTSNIGRHWDIWVAGKVPRWVIYRAWVRVSSCKFWLQVLPAD